MLAGVAEWQTRTFKGRVGDRVGSSPTTSTKKTFGSFFVGIPKICKLLANIMPKSCKNNKFYCYFCRIYYIIKTRRNIV